MNILPIWKVYFVYVDQMLSSSSWSTLITFHIIWLMESLMQRHEVHKVCKSPPICSSWHTSIQPYFQNTSGNLPGNLCKKIISCICFSLLIWLFTEKGLLHFLSSKLNKSVLNVIISTSTTRISNNVSLKIVLPVH